MEGGCPKGRGLAEDERERSQPPALRATSFQRKEGEAVKTIYSLPVEGGCLKGRGLAEDERERSQPPALRATSFQRKEGEVVKNHLPLPVEGGSQANESRAFWHCHSLSGAALYFYAPHHAHCIFSACSLIPVFQRSSL